MNFTELNVKQEIVKALSEEGINEPTDIQAKAIPLMHAGHDVIGISRTGSGKTASFGIPMLEKVEKLKGLTGSPGKVQGKVQIIKDRSDISKFKKGNILVSITTNVSHIVAMQKAKAFVTDEGSITCHAAIVAREMNKPCIVGTKIATKVLKDNDLIEVDADNGVVKIIK